ncbi:MAG TPA: ABC transporter permease, partial [Acidobacteriota bacterium]
MTTTIFTVINGVLLRQLPFKDPDRLMILWEKSRQGDDYSVAYQNYLDWQAQNSAFESMAASRLDRLNMVVSGQTESVRVRMVSFNYLSTLGVPLFLGRDFRSDEDRPGAPPVAILSFNCWKTRFREDSKILGRNIQVNDRPVTVIGVLPEYFHFLTEVDLFLPLGSYSDQWPKRNMHTGIYVFARLKADLTIQKAQADMNQIAARLEKEYPETNAGNGVHMEMLMQNITGEVRSTLWLLFGSVIFVLLIGCANVANMMLARGFSRQKEI